MSTHTVLVTADAFRASAPASERPFHAAGVEVLYPDRMGPLSGEELIPWLAGADAVVAANDPYTAPVLDACPRLRIIARWGTGYDTVDVSSCTARGVLACNAPGQNVEAVADYVFMAMLSLARRLPYQQAVMRAGGWEEVRGVELFRKTVGIVGLGAIGRAVARRARGFECRLLGYDPFVTVEQAQELAVVPVGLDTLAAESDFVTLHATLTPDTRGLIGERFLRRMRPSAFLVNAARGPMVDESALVTALQEGRIAGAALDAFSEEPLPAGHVFRSFPHCIVTPHSAFNTEETAAAINRLVAEQILAGLRGETPPYALNPEAISRRPARPT